MVRRNLIPHMVKFCSSFILVKFLITGFFISSNCYGQSADSGKGTYSNMYELIYSNYHWEYVLMPNITQKAIMTHNPEALYKLGSTAQLSGEFGVNRVLHLNKAYSIIAGIHLGIAGRNGCYVVPDREVGINDNDSYAFTGGMARENDVSYISFPLLFERRYFINEKKGIYFDAGFNLRLSVTGGSTNADMDAMEIKIEGNKKPIINFTVASGFQMLIKNFDILKFGIYVNADPAWLAKGSFWLRTMSSYDSGDYKVEGSCVGLYLSYTRTKARSIIRRVN